MIRELSLSDGSSYSFDVYSGGTSSLKVTIAWTDPPGTPASPQLNPTTPMLVNDLDLRVFNGTTYFPWISDPTNPTNPATTGDNTLDNVEQVLIASPTPGIYTVTINHKGTLSGGGQNYSLILTGGVPVVLSVSVTPDTWAIGAVAAGSTQNSTAFTVTNDGNVAEDFSLSVADPANWTNDTNAGSPDNAAGANEYVLRALFDTASTHTYEVTDCLDDTAQVADDTGGTRFTDGDDSGNNVAVGANKSLYLQFDVPTTGSNTTEQSLTLTITAQQH